MSDNKDMASPASQDRAASPSGLSPASGSSQSGIADAGHTWQPIETAPELERVWVAGIQPRARSGCQAYWWWHEDAVYQGVACDHPTATHWAKIILPAEFPYPAEQAAS